ncbi:SDR family oxidoreductase [Amorphoplanes nipponensis]|uniref:SDR family oxidoreductase n=1 Tax=Actinoplanes nipponensis TaxID=135950 RepID=UPI0031EC83C5
MYVTGRSTDAAVTYPRVGGSVEQTAREVTAAGGAGVAMVCDHTWGQPLSVWDDMFAGGVRAHYAATVLAVPLLRPGALVVTVSFFPGSYLSGEDQVAYSVAKAADDRMIAVMAEQLRPRRVTAVGLYPGLVRTEGVLRAAEFLDLSRSESPEFVGRAVVALAGGPGVARHTGRCLVAAELAAEYGFTDVDGARPVSARAHFRDRAGGG